MAGGSVFTKPNEGDTSLLSPGQGVTDAGHFVVIADGVLGLGVRHGCKVELNSGSIGGTDTLKVVGGGVITEAGGDQVVAENMSLAIGTAETGTTDRIDLVLADTTDGTTSVRAGTAVNGGTPADYVAGVSAPTWPTIPDNHVVLAAVWVEGSATALPATGIVDVRMYISNHSNRINALSPGTGITGDGSTDDGPQIDTALSAGGDWWFPAATYIMATTASINMNDGSLPLSVECAANAIFEGTAALGGNMFQFDTGGFFPFQQRIRWKGGTIDMGQVPNADSKGFETVGFTNEGSASNYDAFSIRGGEYSQFVLEDLVITGRYRSYRNDPRDVASQHWMGSNETPHESPGGDSGVFCNAKGNIIFRNILVLGTRDSAFYIAGTDPYDSHVLIDGCSMFWCAKGVAIKADAHSVDVVNCVGYGVGYAYEVLDSGNGTGPTRVRFSNCTAEVYDRAFNIKTGANASPTAATEVSIKGCTALDAGYLGWDSEATTCRGMVRLTDGGSGSVDSIVVGSGPGTTVTSGSVAFDVDLEVTAKAVRDNINDNTSSPNFWANVRENPDTTGEWEIWITGDDVDADVVTANTTTINTQTEAMDYQWKTPRVLWIEGAQEVDVDGLIARGTTSDWSTNRAAGAQPKAIDIRSVASVQTTDVTIRHLTMDGIDSVGGETTVGGATDPDRTAIESVRMGENITDYSGPTLLGASSYCTYNDKRTIVLNTGSDSTMTSSTTTASLTWTDVQVKQGAIYHVVLHAVVDGEEADELRFLVTDPGSVAEGWWSVLAGGVGASGNSGIINNLARDWSRNIEVGTVGTAGVNDILRVTFEGLLKPAASGTFRFRWRLKNSGGTATMYDYSWMTLERVG